MGRYADMDYTGYTFSFLKRRLGYVFSELRIKKLSQFLEQLNNEDFRENVKYHMAVNVTEMFRDPGFWRSLRDKVFPIYTNKKWSVWFPDTPSGEEVFSLAILLEEEGLINDVDIFCNHPSREKCNEISQGLLDVKNMELNHSNYKRLEMSDRFDEYFYNNGEALKFSKQLLNRCNVSSSYPEEEDVKFDLIIFRNSTINLSFQQREFVLQKLLKGLNPGGIIALGVKESFPGSFKDVLLPLDEKESIFKKPGVSNN